MPTPRSPQVDAAVAAVASGMSQRAAAKAFGVAQSAISRRMEIEVPELPGYQADFDEIFARRAKEYGRRKAAFDARRLIPITVNTTKPIGILWIGDPHLDDPGADIVSAFEHARLTREVDGLYGACVGDYLNNWRGKLAYLHGSQSTTQQEAWRLVEGFIQAGRWLVLVAGNHDVWSGTEDPLIWFTRGQSLYEWHGARLSLRFPNRKECRINVRHSFKGNSQYNKVHGGTKAIRHGGDYHLYVDGHTHEWAEYIEEIAGQDMVSHAIKVRGYKTVDDYADKLGYVSCERGSACLTVIDPCAEDPEDFVTSFWSVKRGVEHLRMLRGE